MRARLSIEHRIRAGELITARETARRIGKPNVIGLTERGHDFHMYGGRRYYEQSAVETIIHDNWPPGHIALGEAALRCRVTIEDFLARAGRPLQRMTCADSYKPIPELVCDAVQATLKTERTHRRDTARRNAAAHPPRVAFTPPGPQVWVSLGSAAEHFGETIAYLDTLMAEQSMPRATYNSILYARRVDIDELTQTHFPRGWLTIAQAAVHVGRNESWVRDMCRRRATTARGATAFTTRLIYARGRKRLLVDQAELDAWKLRNDPTLSGELTLGQAHELLDKRGTVVHTYLISGALPYTGDLTTPKGQRAVRITRADLEAFRREHTPPPDWITVPELREQLAQQDYHISDTAIFTMCREGNLPGRRFMLSGKRWMLPPNAADVLTTRKPGDYVGITVLLKEAGFPNATTRIIAIGRGYGRRHLLPGATRVGPTKHWRYPVESAQTLRALLIEAGHSPDSDAATDSTAA